MHRTREPPRKGGRSRVSFAPAGPGIPASGSSCRRISLPAYNARGVQDSALALSAGLVPVHAGATARSAAEKSLADFAMSGTVCFLAPDTVFYSNRAAFEQRIAAALDLLA